MAQRRRKERSSCQCHRQYIYTISFSVLHDSVGKHCTLKEAYAKKACIKHVNALISNIHASAYLYVQYVWGVAAFLLCKIHGASITGHNIAINMGKAWYSIGSSASPLQNRTGTQNSRHSSSLLREPLSPCIVTSLPHFCSVSNFL